MVVKIIDTNIIVRFLTRDKENLYLIAEGYFNKANKGNISFYFDEVVVAETAWLLDSFYKYTPKEIASSLTKLMIQEWAINPRKKLILKALDLFSKTNVSYIDCWQKVISEDIGLDVLTFDQKLLKLSKT